MDTFQQILVVDDGQRKLDGALSAELAELGFATVTTPLETTEEVLAMISSPSAIVLQVPRDADPRMRGRFMDLAQRLRASNPDAPVLVVDPAAGVMTGGFASVLQSQFKAAALSKPER